MALSFYSQRSFSYGHSLGIWAQVFMTTLMLTILSIKVSLSRVVYISKSKRREKNFHPRRMKWIITNRNHGGCGRSHGRENVGRWLFLSVSPISVGPPWGCKESSSCLGKQNSHHSPSYTNGSLFNVSTSYPCIYFSTLVCLVHILFSVLEAWFMVLFQWDREKKPTIHHTQDIYPHDISQN